MLRIQDPAGAREDPHGGIGGQAGAVVGQGQRDRQELLHLVDTTDHQCRKLADAVAEAQDRLAHRDPEDLLEQLDLRQLHRHDGRRILHEGLERGSFARLHPRRQINLLLQHLSADQRRPVEYRPDDRAIDRMLKEFRSAAQVARIIAAKRDRRGRDLFLQFIARQIMLTRSNTQGHDLFRTRDCLLVPEP